MLLFSGFNSHAEQSISSGFHGLTQQIQTIIVQSWATYSLPRQCTHSTLHCRMYLQCRFSAFQLNTAVVGEHLIGRGVTPNYTINTGRPYNGVAANVRVCGLFHLLVLHVESFFTPDFCFCIIFIGLLEVSDFRIIFSSSIS